MEKVVAGIPKEEKEFLYWEGPFPSHHHVLVSGQYWSQMCLMLEILGAVMTH